jgi:NADPH:quinone reductase-like Zn-dependent oxidoreductase
VIATASAQHLEFVRTLGADEALDYRAPDLPESLHDIDVVIDGVSAANIASIYPAMKPGSVAISLFEFTSQSLRDLMTALVGLVVAGTLEVVRSQTPPGPGGLSSRRPQTRQSRYRALSPPANL